MKSIAMAFCLSMLAICEVVAQSLQASKPILNPLVFSASIGRPWESAVRGFAQWVGSPNNQALVKGTTWELLARSNFGKEGYAGVSPLVKELSKMPNSAQLQEAMASAAALSPKRQKELLTRLDVARQAAAKVVVPELEAVLNDTIRGNDGAGGSVEEIVNRMQEITPVVAALLPLAFYGDESQARVNEASRRQHELQGLLELAVLSKFKATGQALAGAALEDGAVPAAKPLRPSWRSLIPQLGGRDRQEELKRIIAVSGPRIKAVRGVGSVDIGRDYSNNPVGLPSLRIGMKPGVTDVRRALIRALPIFKDLIAAQQVLFFPALVRPVAVPAAPKKWPAELLEGTNHPGKFLNGRTLELRPDETFKFRTHENQIRGISTVDFKGAEEFRHSSVVIEPGDHPVFGATTLVEHGITAPKGARPGDLALVQVSGNYQSRNSPDWSFSFRVRIKKQEN